MAPLSITPTDNSITTTRLVYHGVDPDGALSCALWRARFNRKTNLTSMHPYHRYNNHPIDVPDLETFLSKLPSIIPERHIASNPFNDHQDRGENRERIVFLDLAFNQSLNKLEPVIAELTKKHQLDVYDPEHQMAAENLRPHFSNFVGPESFQGKQLSTGKFLADSLFPVGFWGPSNPVATLYGALAQIADYPDKAPADAKLYIDDLQDLINGMMFEKGNRNVHGLVNSFLLPRLEKKEFVSMIGSELHKFSYPAGISAHQASSEELLAGIPYEFFERYFMKGDLWSKIKIFNYPFEDQVKSYRGKKTQAYTQLDTTFSSFPLGEGMNGAIALSGDILYMKPGIRYVIEKKNAEGQPVGSPFSACIFESGKIIFSKNEQGVDPSNSTYRALNCGEVGKLFKGGGRETGGGGDLGIKVTTDNYGEVREMVIKRIQDDYINKLPK